MTEEKIKTKHLTPCKAIRKYCLDCSGGSRKEVAICRIPECPLWEYRFGKRPQTAKNKSKKV